MISVKGTRISLESLAFRWRRQPASPFTTTGKLQYIPLCRNLWDVTRTHRSRTTTVIIVFGCPRVSFHHLKLQPRTHNPVSRVTDDGNN